MDFVPKKSRVACVLQCGGIWIGGKGWGVTWKLTQCVVKPPEVISVFGTCHIPDEVCSTIEKQAVSDKVANDDEEEEAVDNSVPPLLTTIVDSDDEDEEEAPVVEAPKKKVIKKAEPVPEPVAAVVEEAPKKKIVKKKV
jgi:hypothetical protein